MYETPQTIADWAAETFGIDATVGMMAARVNVEVAELHLEIQMQRPDGIAEEAADVYITMCHMAAVLANRVPSLDVPMVFNNNHQPGSLVDLMANVVYYAAFPVVMHSLQPAMQAVVTRLHKLAVLYHFNLNDEVNKKMVINRARTWNVVNGVGQHVEESK